MYFKKMNRRHRRSSYHKTLTHDKSLQDTTYRCAVCGFICDSKKVKSRASKSRKGLVYADGNIALVTTGTDSTFTSLDSDTGTVTYTNYYPDITTGCPNCGTPDSK